VKNYKDSEIDFFRTQYGKETFHPVGFRLRMRRDLNLIKRHLNGKKITKALCVGCGEGNFEIMLSPYAEKIIALDISPEAIDLAKKNAKHHGITNIEFCRKSFEDLNWDDQFDAIICIAFLHHIPENDLSQFLLNCNKHLKTRGFLYSSDPNADGILRWAGRILLGKNYNKYHSKDERELKIPELRSRLFEAGFNEIHVKPTDFFLIPASYILAGWPAFLLYIVSAIDWLLSHFPFARRGSSFAAISEKK